MFFYRYLDLLSSHKHVYHLAQLANSNTITMRCVCHVLSSLGLV